MMAAPKYRTDSQACSCPGYWYRRTCKHYRAYREAVALVLAQDAVNKAFPPILDNLSGMSRVVSRLTAHWHKGTPAPAATRQPRASWS